MLEAIQRGTGANPSQEQHVKGYFQNHILGNTTGGITPNVIIGSKDLYVGTSGQFKKSPDDYAHRNYCGPAATQVTIRARTTNVPGLEAVATYEHLDPNSGVGDGAVRDALNHYLNTNFYLLSVPSSETNFLDWMGSDIDLGYASTTSLQTYNNTNGYLPGWTLNAAHIVAMRGYYVDPSGTIYVHYVDTAGTAAGYNGAYFNNSCLDKK